MKTITTLMKIITQKIKSRKIIHTINENENENNHNYQLIIAILFTIIRAHCFFVFFVILSVSHVYMAHKKISQIRTKIMKIVQKQQKKFGKIVTCCCYYNSSLNPSWSINGFEQYSIIFLFDKIVIIMLQRFIFNTTYICIRIKITSERLLKIGKLFRY